MQLITAGLILAALICVVPKPCLASRVKRPAEEERLIGWGGETYHPTEQPPPQPKFSTLSWSPRIFLAEDFLTPAETQHLIASAKSRMARSSVVDNESGGSRIDDIRTSSGMFFGRGEDPIIQGIEKRIADWLMVPVHNGEGIQVLKYEKTQKYDAHFDYFFQDAGTANGGNRLVTALMYLSDVEEGGETVFPNVPVPLGQTAANFSACAMKGMAVKPKAGTVVAFWSLQTDGRLDQGSLHGACPVIRGEKWSAPKWIHVGRYAVGDEQPVKVEHVVHRPHRHPVTAGCADRDKRCTEWADSGECKANAGFMVGTKRQPGACLVACDRCDLVANRAPRAPKRRRDSAAISPPENTAADDGSAQLEGTDEM